MGLDLHPRRKNPAAVQRDPIHVKDDIDVSSKGLYLTCMFDRIREPLIAPKNWVFAGTGALERGGYLQHPRPTSKEGSSAEGSSLKSMLSSTSELNRFARTCLSDSMGQGLHDRVLNRWLLKGLPPPGTAHEAQQGMRTDLVTQSQEWFRFPASIRSVHPGTHCRQIGARLRYEEVSRRSIFATTFRRCCTPRQSAARRL